MSTDQPSGFASPDPGAPLSPPPVAPQPGQPYQQQAAAPGPQFAPAPAVGQVPQFGAAQQAMPYAQPQPYPQAAPYGVAQAAPAHMNSGLPIAVAVLAALYALTCIIDIFMFSSRASFANRLITDPESVTFDQANSADNRVNAVTIVALLIFLATMIVWVIWQRSLRKALMPTGQYVNLIKSREYVIFRIVWVVTLLASVFLRGNSDLETPQDVVSHDHKYMLYYGVRAVLGIVLVVMTVRIFKEARKMPQLAQGPYAQQPVGFPQG